MFSERDSASLFPIPSSLLPSPVAATAQSSEFVSCSVEEVTKMHSVGTPLTAGWLARLTLITGPSLHRFARDCREAVVVMVENPQSHFLRAHILSHLFS